MRQNYNPQHQGNRNGPSVIKMYPKVIMLNYDFSKSESPLKSLNVPHNKCT